MTIIEKDPADARDYMRRWDKWLAEGDVVASSVWATTPPGLTVIRDSRTDTTTTVWLSDGEAGQRYAVTNTVTTAQGRTGERTFHLYVRDL